MFYRQRRQIPIYDSFYLDIIVSDDTDKINKATGSNDEEYFACAKKASFRSTSDTGKPCWKKCITIVLNPNDEFSPMTTKVMVHEANHAKNMILERIGYKQDAKNDEASTYFLEWIFGEIEDFYNKVMKKEADKKSSNAGTEE